MPLIQATTGPSWAVIVGNNRDVQIFTSQGPEIRLNNGQWQYVHVENIVSFISKYMENVEAASKIFRVAFCLSLMRIGSLILIPDRKERPRYVSAIDTSKVKNSISKTIEGMNISEFLDGAGMFGVFGSDGLTVVKPNGTIESAGNIISLGTSAERIPGGGRTQAAAASSKFGLAVKVSEDGPISLYRDGKLIIQTNG
ncbi:MAG: hypothetical protein RDA78_08580 [Roseibium sp.]|uniref:hypothetical protein n=1 Tax=Roseibium sp. TaxID=1936156 RepID=UPI003D9C678E